MEANATQIALHVQKEAKALGKAEERIAILKGIEQMPADISKKEILESLRK